MAFEARLVATITALIAVGWMCNACAEGGQIPLDLRYSTTGTIGLAGHEGPAILEFDGIDTKTVAGPGSFNLGDFVLTGPLASATTYNHTPFSITLNLHTLNDQRLNSPPVVLRGELNGVVGGPSSDSLYASFDIQYFDNNALFHDFIVRDSLLSLSLPSGYSRIDGQTSPTRTNVVARLTVTPVPEPSSWVAMLGIPTLLFVRAARQFTPRRQRPLPWIVTGNLPKHAQKTLLSSSPGGLDSPANQGLSARPRAVVGEPIPTMGIDGVGHGRMSRVRESRGSTPYANCAF